MEQRVLGEPDRREPGGRDADHVPGVIPRVEGALEPSNPHAGLQRTQNVHGNERNAVRGAHG